MKKSLVLIAIPTLAGLALLGLLALVGTREDDSERGTAADQPLGNEKFLEFADFELDKAKQKAVWDAEHITFEIEKKFGTAFRETLERRDAEQLKARFMPGAQGSVPLDDSMSPVRHGSLTQWILADETVTPVDVDQLVDWLLSSTEQIVRFSGSTLRVLSIHRTPNTPDVWDTRILLAVKGADADGALVRLKTHQLVKLRITDESTLGTEPAILEWNYESLVKHVGARPLFREQTTQLQLDRVDLADNWTLPTNRVSQYRFQTAVADFNLDGLLDIAVSTHESWLLLTRESVDEPYRDVSLMLGVDFQHRIRSSPAWLAAWLDYDNDGFPDLLIGNRLYQNIKGRRFRDVTDGSGLKFNREAMGAQIADFDCDGLVDLHVVFQGDRYSSSPRPRSWVNDDNNGMPNRLFRNLGNGRFEDVTLKANAGGGDRDSLAACWFFYDHDHYPDLYIANDFSRNVLLRNKGNGTFEDVSESSGVSDYSTSMGVAAGDLNNDGASDLYVANMYSKMGRRIIGHVNANDYPPGLYEQIQGSCSGNRLYLNAGKNGRFVDVGSKFAVDAVGWAYAPAMIDVDNDGWLDLYATTGFLSFDRNEPDG